LGFASLTPTYALKIDKAMRNGTVEKWVVKVMPDGTNYASKVDSYGYVIRGNAGKVLGF
jgi:hypothetical protein